MIVERKTGPKLWKGDGWEEGGGGRGEEMVAYNRHTTSYKLAGRPTAQSDGIRGWSRSVVWSRESASRQGQVQHSALIGKWSRGHSERAHPTNDWRQPALDLNNPHQKLNVRSSHGGRQARRRGNIIVLWIVTQFQLSHIKTALSFPDVVVQQVQCLSVTKCNNQKEPSILPRSQGTTLKG